MHKVDTVFRSFSTAVQSYGLPSRIRSDRGGENVLVANYMLQHPERGPGRGLFITGRSVHNSRDVFRGCTCLFYNLFYHLEEVELLDVDDKFSLHYVYLPKIRKSLEAFKCSWNSHLMSSERGLSPTQQWMRGLALFQGEVAQLSIVCYPIPGLMSFHIIYLQAEAPLYDIDWNAPFSEEDDAQCVEVPHTLNPLTPADFIELCQEINPSNSNFTASNYGIDEYCATVQFVRAKVINY